MKEVEIKFRVLNKDKVLAALAQAGIIFGEEIKQDDTSFTPKDWSSDNSSENTSFLRIRKQGSSNILTVKTPLKNQHDCTEYETTVADAQQMKSIILEIGYVEDKHISKIRQKTTFDNLKLCFDVVDGLGDFIELEKIIKDEEDSKAVQKDLREWIHQTVNPDTIEEVFVGYDILAREIE